MKSLYIILKKQENVLHDDVIGYNTEIYVSWSIPIQVSQSGVGEQRVSVLPLI